MRFKHYLIINIMAVALICWIVISESRHSQHIIQSEVNVLMDTVRAQQHTIYNYKQANAHLKEVVEIRDSLIFQQKEMLKKQKEVIKSYEVNLEGMRALFYDIRRSSLPERYRPDNPR